jgi:hypothetical protein
MQIAAKKRPKNFAMRRSSCLFITNSLYQTGACVKDQGCPDGLMSAEPKEAALFIGNYDFVHDF